MYIMFLTYVLKYRFLLNVNPPTIALTYLTRLQTKKKVLVKYSLATFVRICVSMYVYGYCP